MRKSNIVMIGMPGAGKSTLGVLLAKALKMTFVDTDLLIQQSENRYLQDIINSDGIKSFLFLEERTILSLKLSNHVIATGGSVIYSHSAVKHLKEDGIMVYLKLSYDDINMRINNINSRGIAMEKGRNLKDLYDERIPLYEKYADIIVDCSCKQMEQVVQEIVYALKG